MEPTIEEIREQVKSCKNGEIFLDYFLQNATEVRTWIPVEGSCKKSKRREFRETSSAIGKYVKDLDYELEFIVQPRRTSYYETLGKVSLGLMISQGRHGSGVLQIDSEDMQLSIWDTMFIQSNVDGHQDYDIDLHPKHVKTLRYISDIHKDLSDIVSKYQESTKEFEEKLRKELVEEKKIKY